MKQIVTALSISLILGTAPAIAAPPATITYQGYLATSGGTAVNSSVSMTLKLYDAASGGTLLWSETQPSVGVANGVYSVQMGSVTPINLSFTRQVTCCMPPALQHCQNWPMWLSVMHLFRVVLVQLQAGARSA